MMTWWPWWRMLAGGEIGGGEVLPSRAPVHQIVRECGHGYSGEILVGLADTDAVPPLGGIILLEGRRGYLCLSP